MERSIETAMNKVHEIDDKYVVSTIWETKNEYVFVEERRFGVPPVIVEKRSNRARFARIGDPNDMKLVYNDAKLIERVS